MTASSHPVSRLGFSLLFALIFTLGSALPGFAAPTIPNPSFEVDTFSVNDGSVSDNGPITGWTVSNSTNVGLNPSNGANQFADNGAVPDGSQVAYIGSLGLATTSLSTTITGLTIGENYVVKFRANRYSGLNDPGSSIQLNAGAPTFFDVTPAVDPFNVHVSPYYEVVVGFTATATTAALIIENTPLQDSTLLVDDFSIAVASFHVANNADSGPGSLRSALTDAAAIPGANTITFATALSGQTITLMDEIVVEDVDAVDVDASTLANGITVDGGAGTNRIFYVGDSGNFTLKRFTLTGGNGTDGGAIFAVRSTATITDCTFHGNDVSQRGGALHVVGSTSVVTLNQCTFFDNSSLESGGAIENSGSGGTATVIANQCTFFDNEAGTPSSGHDGGAIHNQANLTLTHCTISGNTADNAGGGLETVFGTATLNYCIIAGNMTPFAGSKDMRASGNLILNGTNIIPVFDNNATTSGTGTISTADPLLGTLADNGGQTQTIAIANNSPAVDAGTGSGVTTDQRGLPVEGTPDLGAFEVLSADSSLSNFSLSDGTLDPVFASGTTSYTASVDFVTTEIAITPTGTEALSNITVNGTPVDSGNSSGNIALPAGDSVITTIVTAPNGVGMTTYTLTVTRLPEDVDGDGNGFTELEEYLLSELLSKFEVGDVVNLDLGAIFFPLPAGQTLSVSGLPKGLKYDKNTGLITGTITAELGSKLVQVTIKQGKTTLGSIPLDFHVDAYAFYGQFEALIEDGTLPIGKAKLVVTKPGTFSATLELQGQKRRSAKGTFVNPPVVNDQTIAVFFKAIKTNPATTVTFEISSDSDLVSGTQDANTLRGFRLAKTGRAPTQLVTVAFENNVDGDRVATPGGTGYATGKSNSKGTLLLKGLLGDAQKLTATLLLSQTHQAVVFVQPYQDKTVSFFGGILNVGDLGDPERGGSSESETDGLQWRKIANATDKSYPAGIGVATPLDINGLVNNWETLPSAEALALALELSGRDVFVDYTAPPSDVLPDRFSLRNNFGLLTITPSNAAVWSGKANAKSGTFAGKLKLDAPAAKTAVSGVLFQNLSIGAEVGIGIVKIPTTTAVKGSFETAGIQLNQIVTVVPAVPATFTVINNADTGVGSLRQAITDAAAAAGPDVIRFAPGLSGQTISFGSEIAISDYDGVEIDASALPGGLTLDGGLTNRIFNSQGTLILRGLTFTRGRATGFEAGGAIRRSGGTLTANQCTFFDNAATNDGGAIFNSNGGIATFVKCTFFDNEASGSSSDGGAIKNSATLVLKHCTISGNTAGNASGGVEASHGSCTLDHTIVSGNSTPFPNNKDIRHSFGSFTLIGQNFITILTGTPTGTGTNSTADPLLDALASNGGPTQTMALQSGSPAINTGTASAITTDQRGEPTVNFPDVGAFEFQGAADPAQFSKVQKGNLEALLGEFRVGDVVNLDLGAILFPQPVGQTIAVSGLPKGLTFDKVTGIISGTILAELGSNPVVISLKVGKKTLDSVVFDLSVAPYDFYGKFEALIESDTGLPIGKAYLFVSKPGTFSATIELQGQKRRATKGTFNNPAVGNSQNIDAVFKAAKNIAETTVTFEIAFDSDLVSGSIGSSTLRGFRLAKAGRAPTQTVTVELQNDVAGDRTNTPGGTGYATGKANSKGQLPLKGLLGDAQKLSTALLMSQTNQAVVFVQPYRDKAVSFFGGIITIGDLGQPERGGSSESETAGLEWRKVANAKDKSYPLGIGVASPLGVTGRVSEWIPAPNAEALALSLGLDSRRFFALYENPGSDVYPYQFTLRNSFLLLATGPTDAVNWSGKANKKNGTVAGRLTLPSPATKTAVTGVFLQDQSFGPLIGSGIVRIPTTTAVRGSFETGGFVFRNTSAP